MNAKSILYCGASILVCASLLILAQWLLEIFPKPKPNRWYSTSTRPPTTSTRKTPSILVAVSRVNNSNISITLQQQLGNVVKLVEVHTEDIDLTLGTTIFNFEVPCSDGQGGTGHCQVTAVDERQLKISEKVNNPEEAVDQCRKKTVVFTYTRCMAALIDSYEDPRPKYVKKGGFFVAVGGSKRLHNTVSLLSWTADYTLERISDVLQHALRKNPADGRKPETVSGQAIFIKINTAETFCFQILYNQVLPCHEEVLYGFKAPTTLPMIEAFTSATEPQSVQQIAQYVQVLADDIVLYHSTVLSHQSWKVKQLTSRHFSVAIHQNRMNGQPALVGLPYYDLA